MRLITTKYMGPTNTRGARIKAQGEGLGSHSIPYPYELSAQKAHDLAVLELLNSSGAGPCECYALATSAPKGFAYMAAPVEGSTAPSFSWPGAPEK